MGERTMREAKLTARLAHPGIITIYDVICVDDRPFIVMELVRAPSLARRVDDEGPVAPRDVARIGVQLLDALAVAHRQGILHRDVKPSNVLLAPGRVVLTDFGIATSEGDATLTSTGLLVGSPTYMSPERLRGEGIGPAADVWSVGATLYAALEGQPPFRATTTMGTITAVLVDEPQPLHVLGPVRDAVVGMLDKNVDTRLTGLQAAQLLQAALAQPGERHAAPSAAVMAQPPTQQPPVMAPMVTWQNPIHLGDEAANPVSAASSSQPGRSFSFVAPSPYVGNGGPGGTSRSDDDHGYDESDDGAWADEGERRTLARRIGWFAAATLVAAAALYSWTDASGSNSPNPAKHSTGTAGQREQHGTGGGQPQQMPAPQTQLPHTASATSTTPATSSPSPATAPTSTASTLPTMTAPTTAPTSTVPTGGSGSGPGPAGFQLVQDPKGFQVRVPDGWTRRDTGASYVDFVSPTNSAMYLRVDQVPKAGDSALQAWRDYEPDLADRLPGFRLVRLASVPYRGWEAADLEFTWQAPHGTLHVLDRGFVTDPRGFALLMSAPDATWQSQGRRIFEIAAASFSPSS